MRADQPDRVLERIVGTVKGFFVETPGGDEPWTKEAEKLRFAAFDAQGAARCLPGTLGPFRP